MDCSGPANATLYIPTTRPADHAAHGHQQGRQDRRLDLDEDRDGKWDNLLLGPPIRRQADLSASIPTGSSSRRGSRSIAEVLILPAREPSRPRAGKNS